MLRHSLATLEGEWEFVAFIEPSFAFGASLSLFLPHRSLFSFPFRRVGASLQARGLARRTAIRAFTQLWTSIEKREKQALREKKILSRYLFIVYVWSRVLSSGCNINNPFVLMRKAFCCCSWLSSYIDSYCLLRETTWNIYRTKI